MSTSYEMPVSGQASCPDMSHDAPPPATRAETDIASRILLAEAVELLNRARAPLSADRQGSLSGPSKTRAARRRIHQDASDPDQPIAARLMAASLCSPDQQAAALADWVRRAHRYLSADQARIGTPR